MLVELGYPSQKVTRPVLAFRGRTRKTAMCSCRCWAEPCSAGECWCRNPLLRACMELPDDLWVRPESGMSGCAVHNDGGVQHCGRRRHGKYEQGKAKDCTLAYWLIGNKQQSSYVETMYFKASALEAVSALGN